MKKCKEIKVDDVEGRTPVGRPRKIWLGNMEAAIAELEIDREDIEEELEKKY